MKVLALSSHRFPVVPICSRAQEEVPMDWTGGQFLCPLSIGSQWLFFREPMAREPLKNRPSATSWKTTRHLAGANHWEQGLRAGQRPRELRSASIETVE
jgi:hypothetical protein